MSTAMIILLVGVVVSATIGILMLESLAEFLKKKKGQNNGQKEGLEV